MAQSPAKSLHIHEPLGGDGAGPFSTVRDEVSAARQNIVAIIGVEPHERPFRRVGIPLSFIIDEPADEATEALVRSLIQGQLLRYEKRVEFTSIDISITNEISNVILKVDIRGVLKSTGDPVQVARLISLEV